MKTIIYTGIGLIIIASAFGMADYYKAKKSGEYARLYHDEPDQPDTVIEKQDPVILPDTSAVPNNVPVVTPRDIRRIVHRTIRMEDYSRGKIREPRVRRVEVVAPVLTPVDSTVVTTVVKQAIVTNPEVQKVIEDEDPPSINLSEFSRAPLREPKKKFKLRLFPKKKDTTVPLH
jgi:hypothetical protein